MLGDVGVTLGMFIGFSFIDFVDFINNQWNLRTVLSYGYVGGTLGLFIGFSVIDIIHSKSIAMISTNSLNHVFKLSLTQNLILRSEVIHSHDTNRSHYAEKISQGLLRFAL